jgi:hypothetical protein
MAKPRKIRHRQSNKPKAKYQQHKRRGDTLFWKAFEFCQGCNADVSLMVRLKENGQIYIFNSDNRWFPSYVRIGRASPSYSLSSFFLLFFLLFLLLFSSYFPFIFLLLSFSSTPLLPPPPPFFFFPFAQFRGYMNGRKSLHYPAPLRIMWQELAAAYQT